MPSVPHNGDDPAADLRPAAELLPPVEGPQRRVRRSEREAQARRSRHRSWPQRILLSVLVLALIGTAAAAGILGYGLYKYDQVERVAVALSAAPPGAAENYLIVGSDTRDTLDETGLDQAGFNGEGAEGSGQRSDTIMVVRADPAQESVDILSFPRDLWVDIADTDHAQRINTAYAAGPQRLVDTIEQNFDIPIHHYVEVDFAGFASLVDAVGGVPVWFDEPVRDVHSGLRIEESGCRVLDPQMALALVRSRHLEHQTDDGWVADPTGDLGRITRQQVFLRRSMDQVRTLGVDDANTLRRLIDVGVESVSIDQALGLSQMVDLGRRFGAVEPEAMRTYSLPADPFTTSGGAAVLRVEEGEAQAILNIFRGLPPDTVFPSQVSNITVLNGTGTDGQAGDVSDALEEVGFDVVGVGDVEAGDGVGDDGGASSVAVTRIRYAPGAERFADLLRRHLTSDAVLIVDETLGDEGIVLETGMDFTTIGREARPADATSSTTSSTAGSSTSEEVGNDDEEPETTTTTDAPGYAPDAESACS